MVDPTTTNLVLAQPLRGSDVGTWDTPVNGNMGIIDQAFGGVTVIALSSAGVILTSSQAQNSIIRITGTLTGSGVGITLPPIYKGWTIDNQLTNSLSSFAVVIASSGGTNLIGIAPGVNDIFYDGTNVKYRNLGRVGEYWDYAGATVPTWVSLCTIPPYLNCNGTAFSSTIYPILANSLGTTTLPDSQGRARYTLDGGTGRLSSAVAGFSPNSVGSAGGNQNLQAHTHNNTLTDLGHTHNTTIPNGNTTTGGGGFTAGGPILSALTGSNNSAPMSLTNASFGTGTTGNIPPAYIGGITMIRAA